MPRFTKTLTVLLAAAVAGMILPGCNTFRGAGKDIQRGGEAIEKAANETQPQLDSPLYSTASAKPGSVAGTSRITFAS